jgi:hypothetical protein
MPPKFMVTPRENAAGEDCIASAPENKEPSPDDKFAKTFSGDWTIQKRGEF